MIKIPDGMVEVTKEEFFRLLREDPRDIMPVLNRRDSTDWQTNDYSRKVWGWTFPGWANPGDGPEIYAVLAKDN